MNPREKMSPEDTKATQKVVLGCMKILFDKSTFQYLKAGLSSDKPMPEKLASETAGVMKLFAGRVQGEIPRQVLLPAGVMLMLEVAKFMSEAGFGEPTGADIKAAAPLLVQYLKKAFPAAGGAPAAPAQASPQAAPVAPAPAAPGMIGGP